MPPLPRPGSGQREDAAGVSRMAAAANAAWHSPGRGRDIITW